MAVKGFKIPSKPVLVQKAMLRVCYALSPLVLAGIYLFGWRCLALLAVVMVFGFATEALFTFKDGKPVTSALFVTCLIYTLSLPPTLPFWMAALGIIFGISFGKMVFGGFGQNVFNPAMAGRCFIYVTFPIQMTGQWAKPFWGGAGGFGAWSVSIDSITSATPLTELREGSLYSVFQLFLGGSSGSMGETSALLILIGGAYILYKKAASWRLAGSMIIGGLLFNILFYALGDGPVSSPAYMLLSGSFLFGALFVVTEPISGAKTKPGQWIYGFLVGSLTVILRSFSNFSEGIMFSILIMNAFVPLIDQIIKALSAKPKGQKK